MVSDKAKKEIRKELKAHFGHADLNKIRAALKTAAVDEWGCRHSEVKLGGGVAVAYTNNPNHFAEFYLKLQGVGMTSTLALTAKDITRAGKQRGCESLYAL
jgi:hypothetical protein